MRTKMKTRKRTRRGTLALHRRKKRLSTAQLKKIYFGKENIPKSHACVYCGSNTSCYHVDHKISIALGGSNRKSNLVICCKRCNLSKGYKRITNWLKNLRCSKKPKDRALYRRIIKHNKGRRSVIAKSIRRIRDSKSKSIKRTA